jgi:hypothetical protein
MIVRWRDRDGKTHNDKVKRADLGEKYRQIERDKGRFTGLKAADE